MPTQRPMLQWETVASSAPEAVPGNIMTAGRDQARRQALPGAGTRAAMPRSAAAELQEHSLAARAVSYGHLAGEYLCRSDAALRPGLMPRCQPVVIRAPMTYPPRVQYLRASKLVPHKQHTDICSWRARTLAAASPGAMRTVATSGATWPRRPRGSASSHEAAAASTSTSPRACTNQDSRAQVATPSASCAGGSAGAVST